MCFEIRNVTPLKNKHAWKVTNEKRMSPTKGHSRYKKGTTVRAKGPFIYAFGEDSRGGIYVFLRKSDAEKIKKNRVNRLILKVAVDPKDFIARGTIYHIYASQGVDLEVATYKKVQVLT